jgi:zinc transport system substrate-binding protein
MRSSLPDGKSTTLMGGKGPAIFCSATTVPDKVALIDPTAEDDAFRLIDLPTRRVHFAVDSGAGEIRLCSSPRTASLHQTRRSRRAGSASSLKLTDPYSMDGHWSDPRPRIAVAGEQGGGDRPPERPSCISWMRHPS